MKNRLLASAIAWGLSWCTALPAQAQNLLRNPDFEARNAIPVAANNVGSGPIATGDVQEWYSPIGSDVASYTSTDGTGSGNISLFGIAPHSLKSAAWLLQHSDNGNHYYDQFVTQYLSAPLQAGHRYKVSFWLNLPEHNAAFHTQLAVTIHSQGPTFNGSNHPNPGPIVLSPSAGTKKVTTGDVKPGQGWQLVSGFIDIPIGETTNQWLTIGYDSNFSQYRDSSLPDPCITGGCSDIVSFIDDAALYDFGCTNSPVAAGLNQTTCSEGQPVVLGSGCDIPGATYSWRVANTSATFSTAIHPTVYPTETTTYILTVLLPDGTSYDSSVTITVFTSEIYDFDVEDWQFCDNNRLSFVPLVSPVGPPDLSVPYGFNGFTVDAWSGDMITPQWWYSPQSGRVALEVVPIIGQVQTYFSFTVTYHYANGCSVTGTYNGGWNSQYCWSQRSAQQEEYTYSVSPNPASSQLLIELSSTAKQKNTTEAVAPATMEVKLYDRFGRLVKQGQSESTSLSLDVSDLPEGIYCLRGGTGKNTLSKNIEIRH